jgi:tRNA pseudouridine38-40 synthase
VVPRSDDLPGDDGISQSVPVWHLSLAYDGTHYHGWQIQPGVKTIQGELQSRLRRLLQRPDLRLAGTSRTDAGVHALDQQVTFPALETEVWEAPELQRVLNRWLPADIRVTQARLQPPGFHARHSATGKAYIYVVSTAELASPFAAPYVWHRPRPLDLPAMCRAASELQGEHDFSTFAVNPRREVDSHVCWLPRILVDTDGQGHVCFVFVGRSFLYRMVRTLVGYLVLVGQGAQAPTDTRRLLEARDRRALTADTAPASGLFLTRVFFAEGEWCHYSPVRLPFAAQCHYVGSSRPRGTSQ